MICFLFLRVMSLFFENPLFVRKFIICCSTFFCNLSKILFYALSSQTIVALFLVSIYVFRDMIVTHFVSYSDSCINSLTEVFIYKGGMISLIVFFFKRACLLTTSKNEFFNEW